LVNISILQYSCIAMIFYIYQIWPAQAYQTGFLPA
jgi:hypothetical protein